jgi:hypothetical protein
MSNIEKNIKNALKQRIIKNHYKDNLIIIEEMTLGNSLSRIDMLAFNTKLSGFEIKSDFDNLLRLDNQVIQYNKYFEEITLIIGYKLFYNAMEKIPDWWGVWIYEIVDDNRINFIKARANKLNKNVEKASILSLMKKNELLKIFNEDNSLSKNKNKIDICIEASKFLSLKEIKSILKKILSLKNSF